ncbi:MAG TPA: sulfatase-like hydrolase/transferase [Candidatus Thermoplasmatota archaeon]
MRPGLRDAVIALSISNLVVLNQWLRVLSLGAAESHYYLSSPIPAVTFLVPIVLVTVGATAAYAGLALARRLPPPWPMRCVRLLFVLATIIGLLWMAVGVGMVEGRPNLVILFGALAAVTAVLAIGAWRGRQWHRRVVPGAVAVVLLLSPLVPILFGQAVYHAATAEGFSATLEAPPGAPLLPVDPGTPRVVWIVFDEFDEELAFRQRPQGLELPAFDRLREEAIVAEQAVATHNSTLKAIPAMTTGRFVDRVVVTGPAELTLDFEDGQANVSWTEAPNVIQAAHERGYNVAVSGWAHPYCRLFASHVAQCAHRGLPAETRIDGWSQLERQAMSVVRDVVPGLALEEALLGPVGVLDAVGQEDRRAYFERHGELHEAASKWAADPTFGFVFVHYPVPHPALPSPREGYYDPSSGRPVVGGSASYFDNLALADSTLADLRLQMESAGLWNSSTVIVTSDHGYRTDLWKPAGPEGSAGENHIPLILKAPDQSAGRSHEPPINLVHMHDLVLAVMDGELETPESFASWFETRRA